MPIYVVFGSLDDSDSPPGGRRSDGGEESEGRACGVGSVKYGYVVRMTSDMHIAAVA